MKVYTLKKTTLLKATPEVVWEYFSTPLNLNDITPPDMSFEILTDLRGLKMYAGMVIHYKVRPFLNLPMKWTTEITHCTEGKYFVDEQRFGPYAFWHHQHIFETTSEGVLMTDIVSYAVGYGILGRIMNAVYIKKKLEGIFDFRELHVQRKFNAE
ncbi:MAG: SRPBCC family protein [Bacteroidota bacterium]|jgi:ligand-binding SRPBCC domain-containing protein